MIFSVDRLDYTKGITHRLTGFEHFLRSYPEWIGKIVFVLVVVPSRQIVSKYNERKKLIEEQIGRINGKYSTLQWQPVAYRYSQLSFTELTAFYAAADIALITPLRDGMNLVSKEFIASRRDNGVLILSELAGAASELSEAILVNPMDRDEVAQALLTALQLPETVQQKNISSMQIRVQEYTVTDWVKDFLGQLDELKKKQLSQRSRHLDGGALERVLSRYDKSKRNLLLLDYDGTLVPFRKKSHLATPDKELLSLLQRLALNSLTDVAIISGRDDMTLGEWFGDLPLILVCEHGTGIRRKGDDWKYLSGIDQSWKSVIRPVLESFTHRSPGAFIEDKHHSIAWHYRKVGLELGIIRSRELLDSLQHLVHNAHLSVIDGNHVIEICVSGIDKGVAASRLLDEQQYEFVLAAGDDQTDENMFRSLADKACTIKIGTGHTQAHYYLSDHLELLQLLDALAG